MKKEHHSDLVEYEYDILTECSPLENYVDETGVRIGTRGSSMLKLTKTQIYKHAIKNKHGIKLDNQCKANKSIHGTALDLSNGNALAAKIYLVLYALPETSLQYRFPNGSRTKE